MHRDEADAGQRDERGVHDPPGLLTADGAAGGSFEPRLLKRVEDSPRAQQPNRGNSHQPAPVGARVANARLTDATP